MIASPRIALDDGQVRVGRLLTRAEFDQLEQVRLSRYFLMRNDGGDYGERAPCRHCGLLHMYFTYMCVERPFRGLESGLRILLRAATDDARRSKLLRALDHLPDLADGHPLTARALVPEQAGEAWYSILLSAAEPISEQTALRLAATINGRRPVIPLVL